MRASGYDRAGGDWHQEPPEAVEALLDVETFLAPVWDPAAGGGNIPQVCQRRGLTAFGSDIVHRRQDIGSHPLFGLGITFVRKHDFLTEPAWLKGCDIISNPPYNVLQKWIDRSLEVTTGKVAILARLAFLEGQARKAWWESVPLARVWVSSKRLSMPPGGSGIKAKGGTIAYAWFVFDRTHEGKPTIGWV